MLIGVVVACEIGFWVVLGIGLVLRYPLGRRRAGAGFLWLAPLVDVVLLVVTVLDLRSGTPARPEHGLAAAYIGFSVAFGHRTIRWADVRFAHRFAGGPPPDPRLRYGTARAINEWKLFGLAVVAWAISCALLLAAIALIEDVDATPLRGWIGRLTATLVIWFVVALSYTIWPKPERSPSR